MALLPRPQDLAAKIAALPRHLLRSLLAVIVGSLILRLSAQTMSQMLQFYFARIDRYYYPLSSTITGLVTASFFVTELIGSPVLGALSDRLGRKKFIIFGPLFGAIAVQITSMTVAIWLLVITRLLEGLSTASSIPATLGYISEATSGRPNLRARIIGLFEITFIGGVAIGAVLGGYLWKYFSTPVSFDGLHITSPAFLLNGLVYLLSLIIFAWGLSDQKPAPTGAAHAAEAGATGYHNKPAQIEKEEDDGRQGSPRLGYNPGSHQTLTHYIKLLESKAVVTFIPAWLAINSILGMWINHTPRLFTGRQHFAGQRLMGAYGPVRFGNGFAIFALIFAAGVLAWSFFIGKRRKTTIMLTATAGLGITLAMVLAINHAGLSAESRVYFETAGLILGLITMSGFTPAALTYLADITETHSHDRGSIMGLYTVFLGIGQVIGTALGGLFATRAGVDGLVLLSALFGAVTVLTLLYLRSHEASLMAETDID